VSLDEARASSKSCTALEGILSPATHPRTNRAIAARRNDFSTWMHRYALANWPNFPCPSPKRSTNDHAHEHCRPSRESPMKPAIYRAAGNSWYLAVMLIALSRNLRREIQALRCARARARTPGLTIIRPRVATAEQKRTDRDEFRDRFRLSVSSSLSFSLSLSLSFFFLSFPFPFFNRPFAQDSVSFATRRSPAR